MDYYSRHHIFASLTEPFTALQVCMQGAMETLLLADRLTFLREHGLSPILLPLFDDLVSPRNIAIVTTLPGKTSCSDDRENSRGSETCALDHSSPLSPRAGK
ncbi:hypothetical protein GBAR_LOCUS19364 [Geodia barretti]|uniref:Uncharacterized protein n=1 Tax=Geodia barretti TaxID=519541 RepID=A0AA35SQH2_GEOBA|nr:hypothetical protein GBAR_LOCUS19364 [Geodia barretti]